MIFANIRLYTELCYRFLSFEDQVVRQCLIAVFALSDSASIVSVGEAALFEEPVLSVYLYNKPRGGNDCHWRRRWKAGCVGCWTHATCHSVWYDFLAYVCVCVCAWYNTYTFFVSFLTKIH